MAHISGPELKAPVHLIRHGERLYIGASGTGSILALDLTSSLPSGNLKAARGSRRKTRCSLRLRRRS